MTLRSRRPTSSSPWRYPPPSIPPAPSRRLCTGATPGPQRRVWAPAGGDPHPLRGPMRGEQCRGLNGGRGGGGDGSAPQWPSDAPRKCVKLRRWATTSSIEVSCFASTASWEVARRTRTRMCVCVCVCVCVRHRDGFRGSYWLLTIFPPGRRPEPRAAPAPKPRPWGLPRPESMPPSTSGAQDG